MVVIASACGTREPVTGLWRWQLQGAKPLGQINGQQAETCQPVFRPGTLGPQKKATATHTLQVVTPPFLKGAHSFNSGLYPRHGDTRTFQEL